jgi:hypothetical protein
MAGFDRKRFARLFLVVGALSLAMYFARSWPKEQTIHYVLGDAAPRVQEVDAKWAEGKTAERDRWAREVTYRYDPGQAPRVLTQEPKLPDGDYTVEIEIVAANDEHAIVRKQIKLAGGVTQIELAPSVPR